MNLQEELKNKKVIVGTDLTLKELKKGNLKKIFLASNCNPEIRKSILYYAKIMGIEVEELKIPNTELGISLKKPFSISVISY
jgi:ribosomal protein L30E